MTGLHLAQYRIDAELGRGGMGIVYKATDTKLNRTVALKVLPAAALSSDDDRARFVREAQSAAQLHHPNIATVFGIDEAVPMEEGKEPQPGTEARLFIAMEYIEGETVREVVEKGPMKLQDAVNVAGQVAEALKEAHAKQIVHRDIKSANVMLTSQGVAKVLDFGLAKTNQSTMLTRMGSTLGTVAYMSPEQARGQEVDGRTDLYSLGTMLYEMVAGKLPFAGDYEQAVLYGIMNEPPEPLTAVRTGVPFELERVVNKLLSKEAEYRYQTAADLLADLKSLSLGGSGVTRRSMAAMSQTRTMAVPAGKTVLPTWVFGAMAGIAVVALAAGWLIRPSGGASPPPVRRITQTFDNLTAIAYPVGSPDGRHWAFAAADSSGSPQGYLWDSRDGTVKPVDGTDNKWWPAFSPDGTWLAMFGGNTVRARIPSGQSLFVDSLDDGFWLDNSTLILGSADELALYRVSAEDQSREKLEVGEVDSVYVSFEHYRFLRDENVVTVTAANRGGSRDILGIDLDSGDIHTLVRGACCALPFQDRYLVYLLGTGQMVAQRLGPDATGMAGLPVDLTTGTQAEWDYGVGGGDLFFHVINPGSATTGEVISILTPETGQTEVLPFPPADYDRLAVSPDGSRIAIERAEAETTSLGSNIVVFDLETRTEQRLTYTVDVNRAPVWTRSDRIFFSGGPSGTPTSIYAKNADGTGDETLIVEDGIYASVSTDEQWMAFTRDQHLYAMNLATGEVTPFDTTGSGRQNDAAISPNGRYLAYTYDPQGGTTVSGEQRLFVRSFPDPDRQYVQLVDSRADDPIWSPDGTKLYYRNNGALFVVEVETEGVFRRVSPPRLIRTYATNTPRFSMNLSDGTLIAVHPAVGMQVDSKPKIEITFSFSRVLESLMSDATGGG